MAIDLDVVTRLDRATTREAAREAQRYFEGAGRDAGEDFGDEFSKGLTGKTPEIQKAFDKVTTASGKLIVEQEKLNALKDKANTTDAQLIAQSQKVAKAYQDEESALRDANRALNDHDSSMRQMSSSMREVEFATQSATSQLTQMGNTFTGLGRAAGPGIVAGLVVGIEGLAAVAANASQSILLLPAAIGAAGAAFGTLKLATMGFAEALESISDPEKFTEALQSLSPNAAEAALSIRSLMPAFDQLRIATQDSLFAGMGQQIQTLTTTYLPMVQSLTTGIAGAFNSMLSGVSGQLMTPETQASISTFASNVSRAFQELAPAAAPLTQALSQLMSVGSGALPRIASAAAEAARSFAGFIDSAARSGELKQWLDSGLEALSQLGRLAFAAGAAFMNLAPAGERILPDLVNVLSFAITGMSEFIDFASRFGPLTSALSAVSTQVDMISAAFRALSGVVESVGNIVAPVLDRIRQAIDKVLEPIRAAIDVANKFGAGIPQIPQSSGSAGVAARAGVQLDPNSPAFGQARAGVGGGAGMFRLPTMTGGVGGGVMGDTVIGGWSGRAFSADYDPVKEAEAATKAAAANEPPPQFDPSQWQVDPTTMMAGGPAPIPGTGPGGFVVDQARVQSASERLSESKLRLLELEADTNVKQSTLVAARNNVAQAERELYEAQQGTWKKANDVISGAMGDLNSIFAPFDEDFGISGGLPGVVKNLTTLLGNFALAGAIKGSPDLQQGAAFLMSQGGTGGGGATAYAGSYGSATYGASMPGFSGTGFGGGGYAGDQALLAGVPAGRYSQEAGRELLQGVSDCSSSIGDLVAILDGRDPNSNANLTTHNAASMLPGMGFVRGQGGPGDFRVGYNSGHMQATLPGGTPWNWGSDASAANRGIGGTGADDSAFTDHWYRPVAATPSAMGPAPLQPGVGTGPAPGPTSWGGNGGLPSIIPGSAGQGFLGANTNGPGIGGGAAGTSYGNTASGGGGQGGIGVSDGLMGMAGGAADIMAPGSSVALKLANRAIQYGSQAAAIGVQGAIDTFLPAGSPLAAGSWFGKLVGGLAGAKPASPNTAGGKQPPKQQGGQQGGPVDQSMNNQITINNQRATEDGTGKDLTAHLGAMHQGPMR